MRYSRVQLLIKLQAESRGVLKVHLNRPDLSMNLKSSAAGSCSVSFFKELLIVPEEEKFIQIDWTKRIGASSWSVSDLQHVSWWFLKKLPEETSIAAFRFWFSAPEVKASWWRGANRKLSQYQKLFVEDDHRNEILYLWFGSLRPEAQGETRLRPFCVDLIWSPGFFSRQFSSLRLDLAGLADCLWIWTWSGLMFLYDSGSTWTLAQWATDLIPGETLEVTLTMDELQFEPCVQFKSVVFFSFRLRRFTFCLIREATDGRKQVFTAENICLTRVWWRKPEEQWRLSLFKSMENGSVHTMRGNKDQKFRCLKI